MTNNVLLAAALAYAAEGLYVFPMRPGSKGFFSKEALHDGEGRGGFYAATRDKTVIRKWWTKWPNANIGIACGTSRLVVVDIDIKDGARGEESWVALEAKYETFSETRTSVTASGGRQKWFRHHLPVIKNSESKLGAGLVAAQSGIDVRGSGGLVIAPPSKITGGNHLGEYVWESGAPESIADLPDTLVSLLVKKPAPQETTPILSPTKPELQIALDCLAQFSPDRCDSEEEWTQVGMALHSMDPTDSGLKVWDNWSKGSKKYQPGECTKRWMRFTRTGGLSLGSLIQWARQDLFQALRVTDDEDRKTELLSQLFVAVARSGVAQLSRWRQKVKSAGLCTVGDFNAGVKEAKKEQADAKKSRKMLTRDYWKLYEAWGFHARLNMMNDDVELNGEHLRDVINSKISNRVEDYCTKQGFVFYFSHARRSLDEMALEDEYHPIREYLEKTEWDGADHIQKLVDHFKDSESLAATYLKHFLIGSVAKIYEGFQNPLLVMIGVQNLGKSFFCEWLCGSVPQLFAEQAIYPDNKDSRLRLVNVWIWEVKELEATTRHSDVSALKAFLTLTMVRDRKPYGRGDTIKPPVSNFIGTMNDEGGFLLDRTGNRRFHVLTITDIDWGYSETVDRDQLWAQAYAIYIRQKEKGWEASDSDPTWRLSRKELVRRDESNLQYMAPNAVDEILAEHYEYTGKAEDRVTMVEALSKARTYGVTAAPRVIGSVFIGWGAVKVRPKKVTTYLGIRERPESGAMGWYNEQ